MWPKQSDVRAFYGDPDQDHDGIASRMWEVENLERIAPPYGMVLAWDKTRKLNSITIHKKCASSLFRILTKIADHYGSQEKLEAARMHLYGGAYNFRMMRGSTKLSMHAYGCAIDLDPASNGLGIKYREANGMMPMAVVNIFRAEGWRWGGDFKRPDCMHFEAVIA
jgi:hypothetical protein